MHSSASSRLLGKPTQLVVAALNELFVQPGSPTAAIMVYDTLGQVPYAGGTYNVLSSRRTLTGGNTMLLVASSNLSQVAKLRFERIVHELG